MNKISSTEAATLLKQAGVAIRVVTKERDVALAKLAAIQREQHVERIARDMEDKGLSPDLSYEEKIAAVRSSKDLRITEEAVKMAAPQGMSLGNLGDQPGIGDGASRLEAYILTGEDPAE
jgi:hypothetical protein